MSPMLFADALREDKSIKVYNNGDMIRDFTYIDDIIKEMAELSGYIFHGKESSLCGCCSRLDVDGGWKEILRNRRGR